jgi:hypothetical protein
MMTPCKPTEPEQIPASPVAWASTCPPQHIELHHLSKGTQLSLLEIAHPSVEEYHKATAQFGLVHRKTSLFYKTMNGAEVGDLPMSSIHTCELNHIHPFDYLTELMRHSEELKANPSTWMCGTTATH